MMGLSIVIKRQCGYCGRISRTAKVITPDQMSDCLWDLDESNWNSMSMDSRLPGKIFCSSLCKFNALDEAGIDYSNDPPAFA